MEQQTVFTFEVDGGLCIFCACHAADRVDVRGGVAVACEPAIEEGLEDLRLVLLAVEDLCHIPELEVGFARLVVDDTGDALPLVNTVDFPIETHIAYTRYRQGAGTGILGCHITERDLREVEVQDIADVTAHHLLGKYIPFEGIKKSVVSRIGGKAGTQGFDNGCGQCLALIGLIEVLYGIVKDRAE